MIGALAGHTHPVIPMDLRREITDDHNEVIAVFRLAHKGNDTVIRIVAIDPFKTVPVKIHLPEGLVIIVKSVELPGIFLHLRMHGILLHQMPVQAVIKVPLNELAELTAHEQQFLAWMSHPVGKEGPQAGKLLPVIPRHLADQGTLSMDHFIMGQGQHKVLRKSVHEGEGELILVPFAIDRIQAHIIQHVVHPAHIPFVIEAHAACVYRLGNQRPGCGFLRDHQRVGMILEYGLIQLLDEIHGFQIARIPVFIRLPFPVLPGVIQIKHIGHRIDAQPVNMEFLQPEQRVGNQEALDLGAAVIKVGGSPFPVLRPLLIIRLVKGLPVEMTQSLIVLAEMARHPVHDDGNAVFMGLVYQIHEVLRFAVAAGYRIIACSLIAPGAIIGMLTEGHELQMGVMHILHVLDELISQLPVAQVASLQRTPPGTQMHLIGQHRALIGTLLFLLLVPFPIMPLIAGKIIDLGSRLGLFLSEKAIGVRLHDMGTAPLGPDSVFIDGFLLQTLDEHAPDFPIVDFLHLIAAGIPFVEVAHHTH